MKKNTFKIVTAALAAVLAINIFSINSKPASAEEINSIETVETENSNERLIYEHVNKDGFIERVYLENTPDSYNTESTNLILTFKLFDQYGEIVRNKMDTSWAYDGAVPTYPFLARYENTPIAVNASNITYQGSSTKQGKENGLYFTFYEAIFSYTYQGKPFTWICGLTFYSNGTYESTGVK